MHTKNSIRSIFSFISRCPRNASTILASFENISPRIPPLFFCRLYSIGTIRGIFSFTYFNIQFSSTKNVYITINALHTYAYSSLSSSLLSAVISISSNSISSLQQRKISVSTFIGVVTHLVAQLRDSSTKTPRLSSQSNAALISAR